MAKRKPTDDQKGKPANDRHKTRKMVAIREPFIDLVQQLADSKVVDFSDEVNRAVLEMLQREGLWPRRRDDCSSPKGDTPPPEK